MSINPSITTIVIKTTLYVYKNNETISLNLTLSRPANTITALTTSNKIPKRNGLRTRGLRTQYSSRDPLESSQREANTLDPRTLNRVRIETRNKIRGDVWNCCIWDL